MLTTPLLQHRFRFLVFWRELPQQAVVTRATASTELRVAGVHLFCSRGVTLARTVNFSFHQRAGIDLET